MDVAWLLAVVVVVLSSTVVVGLQAAIVTVSPTKRVAVRNGGVTRRTLSDIR